MLRKELLKLCNCLQEASNSEVIFFFFYICMKLQMWKWWRRETQRGRKGEEEEKEIEQDIFTELKVSTSASHRPTLQLPQSTQTERGSNVSVHHWSSPCSITTGSDVSLNVPISFRNILVKVCYYGIYSWLKLNDSVQGSLFPQLVIYIGQSYYRLEWTQTGRDCSYGCRQVTEIHVQCYIVKDLLMK